MVKKISHLAAALVGAAAVLASASSAACTLAPTDPFRIKQMMAREIAYRLGMRPQQIALDAITFPRLHTPLELGADCSGLASYHHSAGFRIEPRWAGPGPGPGPWPGLRPRPWPRSEPEPEPEAGKAHRPDAAPWPDTGDDRGPHRERCVYEGAAVVLGYGYASPVAVHFERNCRGRHGGHGGGTG